jgi:hypothetical protein
LVVASLVDANATAFDLDAICDDETDEAASDGVVPVAPAQPWATMTRAAAAAPQTLRFITIPPSVWGKAYGAILVAIWTARPVATGYSSSTG